MATVKSRLWGRKKKGTGALLQQPLLLSDNSSFAVQEAFKTLRTNILFALSTSQDKAVVFTSALASEGKSVTCANLAVTMAQTGAKVLLIDADMRNPVQAKRFKLRDSSGLAHVLGGFCSPEEGISKKVLPGLDVMTSGKTPPNPSELLCSAGMDVLKAYYEKAYDFVLIDAPPVNIVTDPLLAAKYAAGVVFVVRQGCSAHDDIRRALASIEFSGTKLLGMVLSDVKASHNSYYSRYYQKSD